MAQMAMQRQRAPQAERPASSSQLLEASRQPVHADVFNDIGAYAVGQRKLFGAGVKCPGAVQTQVTSTHRHNAPPVMAHAETAIGLNQGPNVAQLQAISNMLNGDRRIAEPPAQPPSQAGPNMTGLPNKLKAGVEALSGLSMDHVRVHRNSTEPAQMQAHAYAQGHDIHLGKGQERHLPHEAWHIVQQAQGRVKPTIQMKHGLTVNDDAGLEAEADVMGARALSGGAAARAQSGNLEPSRLPSSVARGDAPVQRVLVIEDVPRHQRSGGNWEHRVFDNEGTFMQFVQTTIPPAQGGAYSADFWKTPIMADYLAMVRKERHETRDLETLRRDVTVGEFMQFVQTDIPPVQGGAYSARFWDTPIMAGYLAQVRNGTLAKLERPAFVRAVNEAVGDAERIDTLDPMGPVPNHRENLTFGEATDAGLHGHAHGPVGYAGKMLGKELTPLLKGISAVCLTTGTIEDLQPSFARKPTWNRQNVHKEEGGTRRLGLSIINYSEAIYISGQTLAVCGIRGKVLMDQFALAIREVGDATYGQKIDVTTVFNREAVEWNYSRLRKFFEENREFQQASTIVFGYANAFVEEGAHTKVKSVTSHGWDGVLFLGPNEKYYAVFDSDLTHSYHGEILACNVEELLNSPVGSHVSKVLIGGSAGSLVYPKIQNLPGGHMIEQSSQEELVQNEMYIPDAILRPDGYFKENALSGVKLSEEQMLSTLPGSMHTSVISVLAETPGVLEDLWRFGVKTVDMEFAYVALVLGSLELPEPGTRDLANVELGIACLVTDFPRTAGAAHLTEKNESKKRKTKEAFVDLVRKSVEGL